MPLPTNQSIYKFAHAGASDIIPLGSILPGSILTSGAGAIFLGTDTDVKLIGFNCGESAIATQNIVAGHFINIWENDSIRSVRLAQAPGYPCHGVAISSGNSGDPIWFVTRSGAVIKDARLIGDNREAIYRASSIPGYAIAAADVGQILGWRSGAEFIYSPEMVL